MEEADSPISQAQFQTQVAPVALRAPLREVTNTNGQGAKKMSEEQAASLMSLLLQEKRNVIRETPQPRHVPQQASDGFLVEAVEPNMSNSPPTKTTSKRTSAHSSLVMEKAPDEPIVIRRESGESRRASTVGRPGSEHRDSGAPGAAEIPSTDGASQTSCTIRKTAEVSQMPPSTKAHFHTWRQEAMAGRYVRRRASRIPKDQAQLLDSRDCWQPAAPGRDTRPATDPINLLQELSARADAAADQEQEERGGRNQQLKEDPLELPAAKPITSTKPFHISQLPSSQELPSSQWSPSPERQQPAAGLPPDSSPPEEPLKSPQHVLPKGTIPVDDAEMARSPPPSERAVQVKQTPYPGKAELPRTTMQPSSTYVPSTFPDARKRGLSDSVPQVPLKRARKASSSAEEDITYSQIARSKLQYRRTILRPLSKEKPSVASWVEQTAQTSREASVELGTPNIDRSSSGSVEEAALMTRVAPTEKSRPSSPFAAPGKSILVEEAALTPKPVPKTKKTSRLSASPFAAPFRSVSVEEAALTPRLITQSKERQHPPSASPFARPLGKQQRSWQQEQTPFKRFVEAFNSLPGKATKEGAVNVFAWRSERAS